MGGFYVIVHYNFNDEFPIPIDLSLYSMRLKEGTSRTAKDVAFPVGRRES